MLKILRTRLGQGRRTLAWPAREPELSDRFRGRPVIDAAACAPDCDRCVAACPTQAILAVNGRVASIDLGRCLFCADCADVCPAGAIRHAGDYRLAASRREDLVVDAPGPAAPPPVRLDAECRRLFGRSLSLRQVSAGGCNACEADTNVLSTIAYDLGRFGIRFTASPRHADGLLITGPVTANMRDALLTTWEAVPSPRLVIAVGACAIAGGLFGGHVEAHDGAGNCLPVDLYVPGCPPHPLTILEGLLRLLGRLPAPAAATPGDGL
jgi:Ni,Fe-hydrogenase III small subunit/Pyruvate/2-oxoacid:ferredoxin oxidoreductase delta subunit